MRKLNFFALVSLFLVAACPAGPVAGKVTSQQSSVQNSNYVVIGAFAVQKNAVKFTSYAKRQSFPAQYELNPNRSLYYVYVLRTDDHQAALNEAIRLRENTEFTDAWVFGGWLGDRPPDDSHVDINPVTEEKMEEVPSSDTSAAILIQEETTPVVTTPEPDNGKDGKKFKFVLFRAIDGAEVQGDVDVIDPDKTRKVGTYKGNESVHVATPNNKSGQITLTAEVFGYRKVQRDVSFNNPEGEGITTDEEGNVVVPFELVRLQKGDIAVMYNVYFFKDAGVMRPESRYEVNSLVQMLKENEKYKIRIHGHTNGSAPGKIISMGESKNFFALTDTKEGYGSAKKLSEERGNVIMEYLIAEGIDHKRMHVKAWGGKRPVHDKHSTRANENVRVEIEILEDK